MVCESDSARSKTSPGTKPVGIRALRRARILHAINVEGLALIARHGVDGWTMADLARAVGLTPGAFYRYFRSKEDIIAAVQVSVLQQLLEGWGVVEAELGRRHRGQLNPVTRLIVAGLVHERLSVASPPRFSLLTMSMTSPKNLIADERLAPVGAATLKLVAGVAELTRTAREEGWFTGEELCSYDDHDRAAQWVFGQQGLLQLQRVNQRIEGMADIHRAVTGLRESLLRAWGVDATQVHTSIEEVSALDLDWVDATLRGAKSDDQTEGEV